jgi:hypothetical protein
MGKWTWFSRTSSIVILSIKAEMNDERQLRLFLEFRIEKPIERQKNAINSSGGR